MPYVAPTPKATNNQPVSTVEYNTIVNDIIDLNSRVNYVAGGIGASTPQTINQSVVGSASNLLLLTPSWTADTSKQYRIDIYAPYVETAGGATSEIQIWLWDQTAGSVIVEVARFQSVGGLMRAPLQTSFYYVPATTSASIQLRATKVSAGGTNGVIASGTGAAGSLGRIRVMIFGPYV